MITVASPDGCDLSEVEIIDSIPVVETEDGDLPAFTVVSTDPAATSQTEGEVLWSIGAVTGGEALTVTLTALFDEPAAEGSRVENEACVTAAELDEPFCSELTVAVGDVSGAARGPGFWCNHIRFALEGRHNAKLSVDEVEEWIGDIDESSAVFSEIWDLSTIEAARDLLCFPSEAENAADRLARHLLTLWLNVASERLDSELTLGVLPGGDEPAPDDMDPSMTIGEVLEEAEQAVLDGATDEVLRGWAELIDFINNTSSGLERNAEGRMSGVRRGGGHS